MHRVLIVGVGAIGERHLRCFIDTGRATVGICEPDTERCRTVVANHGIRRAYTSFGEALEDEWDAAVIASPAPTHIPMALRLAEAGLPMLIEKPLSVDTSGVDELIGLIERTGLTVAVGYILRSHPAFAAMRKAIHSGRFGRPLQVVGVRGVHTATRRPGYDTIYYARREQGGGAIQDIMTHTLNAAEWLVGPMDLVAADAEHLGLPNVTVEDTVHVLGRHDKVMACYTLNQYQFPGENTLTFVCERGTVRMEFHQNRWRCMTEPDGEWQNHPVDIPDKDTLFRMQAAQFLDAVEGKDRPLCTVSEAHVTLNTCQHIMLAVGDSGRG